jgi:uncharacterized protein (DUF305 family)
MKISSLWTAASGLLALLTLASCGMATRESAPKGVQPGAPGDSSRVLTAGAVAERGHSRHTEADVRFMQGMIAHHAQALEMTSLVPTRSSREDIHLLAQRIEASQQHEIGLMRRWLEQRGEEVPNLSAHHAHHGAGVQHELMPGMLTPDELARLASATGAEFDRLFLELMIRHHEGALLMVQNLFASTGAGQDVDVFRIASEVDADQNMEIARMRRMLNVPSTGVQRR